MLNNISLNSLICLQAATSLDVEPFVPIYRALVSRFSPTVVMSFLKSASNDLLKLFQLDNPQVGYGCIV